MLERLLTECIITVDLDVAGRLLVKESNEDTDARYRGQSEPHKVVQPVKVRRADGSMGLYVPGASLKGALRAHAERIARTLNAQGAGACDPFTVLRPGNAPPADLACSERIAIRQRYHQRIQLQTPSGRELTIPMQYRDVCPICRTFGHLGWGRRLRISDFYPSVAPGSLTMTHIGIDRVAGGVSTPYEGSNNYGSGRTFALEYAYRGALRGQFVLENFELWQLGLLGYLWQDMADGLLPIGHKQTTGTGELHPRLIEMRLTRLGEAPADGSIAGIGALWPEPAPYGYDAQTDVLVWPDLRWTRPSGGVRWEAMLGADEVARLWTALAPRTARVLREHRWPDTMAPARLERLGNTEAA